MSFAQMRTHSGWQSVKIKDFAVSFFMRYWGRLGDEEAQQDRMRSALDITPVLVVFGKESDIPGRYITFLSKKRSFSAFQLPIDKKKKRLIARSSSGVRARGVKNLPHFRVQPQRRALVMNSLRVHEVPIIRNALLFLPFFRAIFHTFFFLVHTNECDSIWIAPPHGGPI